MISQRPGVLWQGAVAFGVGWQIRENILKTSWKKHQGNTQYFRERTLESIYCNVEHQVYCKGLDVQLRQWRSKQHTHTGILIVSLDLTSKTYPFQLPFQLSSWCLEQSPNNKGRQKWRIEREQHPHSPYSADMNRRERKNGGAGICCRYIV